MVLRLVAIALVAFTMSSYSATSAEARVCKNYRVAATGAWRNTFTGARSSARWSWRRKVRRNHGRRYGTWWLARNKSYGCWAYMGRKRCRVRARPCRLGN